MNRVTKRAGIMLIFVLLLVGGLGFFVWEDLLLAKNWRSLTLYSRLAISATGVLLLAGCVEEGAFQADAIITGQEAATMIQNALDLAEPMVLPEENLTRGEAAQVLYQVSQLKSDAPGMAVLNTQA